MAVAGKKGKHSQIGGKTGYNSEMALPISFSAHFAPMLIPSCLI